MKIISLNSLLRIRKEIISLIKKYFLRKSLTHSWIQFLQSQMNSHIVLRNIFATIVSTTISNFLVQLLRQSRQVFTMLVLETTTTKKIKNICYCKSIWTYDLSALFEEDDTWYKKVFDVAKKTQLKPVLTAGARENLIKENELE